MHRSKTRPALIENIYYPVCHSNAGVQKYGRAIAPRDQKVYAREWDFQRQIIDGKVYSGVCYQQFLCATKFQKNFCTPALMFIFNQETSALQKCQW